MAGIVRAATPDQSSKKKVPGSEAKKSIKALAVECGLSKDIASQSHSPPAKSKKILQEEDFPALDAVKSGVSRTGTPAVSAMPTPKGSPMVKKARVETAEKAASAAAEKKAAPITLNIAAAVKAAAVKTPSDTPAASATEKTDSSAFPALPPPSAAVASPSVKAAPKTLRVVNTPKAENPPALVNAATRAVSGISRPATPASHDISDSASIVSTAISASRTSSPPPARIGSAPVRSTTKSQQRKARKDATKEQSAALSETRPVEPEEHAPILGRQKKKKKEKAAPAPKPEKAPKKVEAKVEVTPPAPAVETKASSSSSPAKKSAKEAKNPEPAKSQAKTTQPTAPKAVQEASSSSTIRAISLPQPAEGQEPAENPKTMPDIVFQDLVRSGMTAGPDYLSLLKVFGEPAPGTHRTFSVFTMPPASNPNPPPSTKNIVSEQDHATLLSGMPVHKTVDEHRVMITPNGDCLRNLSEEEEQKYLFYQKRVARAADQPDSFVAPRHQPRAGGFSLVKGRAVPNGPPSFFPPNPAASQRLFSDDPVNKLQREEAISYINQFVLPRLNLGTANLGFPGGFKSAPGAANGGAAGKDGAGTPTHRDVAAASLNSLAPWIYGHDAAAGAGIYSAESGGAGMKDIPEDETPFGGLEAPPGHGHDGTGGQHQAPHAHQHPASKMPPLNGISLMSVEDAETALQLARKETEKLEKGLNQVIKRNRRLLLPGGGR